MKKQVLATLAAAAMMTASVASASPLTDYSQGKVSVDLTYRNAKQTVEDNVYGKATFNQKYNPEVGVTVGLGGNFALQYNGSYYESKDTSIPSWGTTYKNKFQSNEYNLLYKLDKHVSGYVGINRIQAKEIEIGSTWHADSKAESRFQAGLIGTTTLAKDLVGYANLGVASDLVKWGIGVGYQFAPGLEFNVDYMETKINKFDFSSSHLPNNDGTAKGLGFGVTYKF